MHGCSRRFDTARTEDPPRLPLTGDSADGVSAIQTGFIAFSSLDLVSDAQMTVQTLGHCQSKLYKSRDQQYYLVLSSQSGGSGRFQQCLQPACRLCEKILN